MFFVKQSTFDEVRRKLADAENDKEALLAKWNNLVEQINKKGGQAFLKRGVLPEKVPQPVTQFSQDEIKKLLLLCHPDRHDGKAMATELTQKLLKLRK